MVVAVVVTSPPAPVPPPAVTPSTRGRWEPVRETPQSVGGRNVILP